ACSSKVLKPGFIRNILSLNFLFPDALRSAGRKVPVFILLTFTSGFLLCAKCAPQFFAQFFDIFISNPILRAKTLVAAGFSTVPGMENGFLEFVYLLNLYYGKYYIPLIFIIINSVIVWQNRKRFCHHFVRRYPRFLALYLATFFLEVVFL